jgi:hypothetical protein
MHTNAIAALESQRKLDPFVRHDKVSVDIAARALQPLFSAAHMTYALSEKMMEKGFVPEADSPDVLQVRSVLKDFKLDGRGGGGGGEDLEPVSLSTLRDVSKILSMMEVELLYVGVAAYSAALSALQW